MLVPALLIIIVAAGIQSAAASALARVRLSNAFADGARAVAFALQAEYAQDRGQVRPLTDFAEKLVAADTAVVLVRFYRVVDGRPVVWASSRRGDAATYRPGPQDLSPLDNGSTVQAEERLPETGELVLETIMPIRLDGMVDASVGIYTSLRERDAAATEAVQQIALSTAVSTLAVSVAIVSVAYVIGLRRLVRLRRAAERVAAGDLSVRLPEGDEPPARDEIVAVAREFDHTVREVARQRVTLEELAGTDSLTLLPNRRAFDVRLGLEVDRASRIGYPLALSLVDLDSFKALNDSAGHLAGDEALRRVARALEQATRQTDIVVRYGGDEFVVIHPGCDEGAATAVGWRTRAAVEQLRITSGPRGRLLSASVGIAEYGPGLAAPDLVAAADAALYRAKARGGGVEVSTLEARSAATE